MKTTYEILCGLDGAAIDILIKYEIDRNTGVLCYRMDIINDLTAIKEACEYIVLHSQVDFRLSERVTKFLESECAL